MEVREALHDVMPLSRGQEVQEVTEVMPVMAMGRLMSEVMEVEVFLQELH